MGGAPRRYLVTASDGILSPARIRAVEDPWSLHAGGKSTGADYLIIAHPAFAGALGPLVSLRQSQGLVTAVVNVLGIYDAWGDGRPDPEAIRAFIANARDGIAQHSFLVRCLLTPKAIGQFYPTFIRLSSQRGSWAGEMTTGNRFAPWMEAECCRYVDQAVPVRRGRAGWRWQILF
jgi:hypothetical protein